MQPNRVLTKEKGLRINLRKKTKYIKTALQIAKDGTPKDRKAKERAQAEKPKNWTDSTLQTAQKTTTQEKSWVEDGSGKTAWKSHTQMREKSPA